LPGLRSPKKLGCPIGCYALHWKKSLIGGKVVSLSGLHSQTFGKQSQCSATISGRLQILGSYSAYFGGDVLTCALPLGVKVLVGPGDESMIRFYSPELKEKKKTALSPIKFRKEDRWANYMKGALLWAKNQGLSLSAASFSVGGDLPKDMGLGASQAMTLATLYAAKDYYDWAVDPAQFISGAHWVETEFLGRPIPQSDFAALEHSQEGFYTLGRPSVGVWEHLEAAQGAQLYTITSDLPMSSFEYSLEEILSGCREGLLAWGWSPDNPSLHLDSDSVATKPSGVSHANHRRCQFLLDENTRVKEGAMALTSGDWSWAGKLLNRSHEGLRDFFEVSCPEMDWLVKRCQELSEVYGAKITGEGIGKSIVVLAQEGLEEILEPVIGEYERIFGFKAKVNLVVPVRGLPNRSPS
jgi:galactokinase